MITFLNNCYNDCGAGFSLAIISCLGEDEQARYTDEDEEKIFSTMMMMMMMMMISSFNDDRCRSPV